MSKRTLRAVLAAGILLVASTSAVRAHVELVASSPIVGSNLPVAPTEVTITFDDELDPDLSSFTVVDSSDVEVGSGEVDLTVADRTVMEGPVTITTPGVYTVRYTVAGHDGHPLDGTFSFGYQATSPIPDPTAEEPDAAMRAPGPGPIFVLIGALLLTLAATLAVRRIALR